LGLRAIAESDLSKILEDKDFGFGWDITLTDPNETTVTGLIGFSNDIAQMIDPDTGQAVSGRLASAVLRISSITAAGLELPVGISDETLKPWVVEFKDINGNDHVFKVVKSNPDRALGIVSLILESYID
jgi:hypothetical protein